MQSTHTQKKTFYPQEFLKANKH